MEDFSEIGTDDVSGGSSPAPDTGTPAEAPAEAAAQPAESASGDVTPAEPPASEEYTPRANARIQQLIRERDEAVGRATQSQAWDPILQELQRAGLTPEEAQAYLANPQQYQQPQQPAPDPADLFEQHLEQLGKAENFDPYTLEPHQRAILQRAFEAEQRISQFEQGLQQREQERQQNEYRQEARTQYSAIVANPKYALFKDDTLKAVLGMAYDQAGGKVPMAQLAEQVLQSVDRVAQARLAEYQTARQQRDAGTGPVVTGGNAPAPSPTVNPHNLSREEREKWFSS